MKRSLAAVVLLLFATALSYATAAETLGHHHRGPAGCDDAYLHFCSEQTPHDADHCTFCHFDGVSFALPCVEAPVVERPCSPVLVVAAVAHSSSLAFGPFAPRGPPVLLS